MDATLRALRREVRQSPGDFAVARRLAVACERAGEVDEAWDTIAPFEHGADGARDAALETLGGLAERNPGWLLERLLRVHIRSARKVVDVLIEAGRGDHPAFVALASDQRVDRPLRRHAQRAIQKSLPGDMREIADIEPETLRTEASAIALDRRRDKKHGFRVPDALVSDRNERWRSFAERLFDRAGAGGAVALLPWLVPLLTSRDPVLAGRALEIVRRLTDRDGPPFPVEVLTRALGSAPPRA